MPVKRGLLPKEDGNERNGGNQKRRKIADGMLIMIQDEIFGGSADDKAGSLNYLEERYEEMLTKKSYVNEDNDMISNTESLSISSRSSSLHPKYNTSNSSTDSLSSSFSSYTKPQKGPKISDSLVPGSSILDDSEENLDPGHQLSRDNMKSRVSLKKESFDDTSKDFSDIEDWENEVQSLDG